MYSYCFNNPVNLDDPSGSWPKWVNKVVNTVKKTVSKVVNKVKSVVNKVKQDVQNFDVNNTSESKVLRSNYFSSYKGKFVVRTNGTRSGSYGALFITKETSERPNPADIIRHEYGHTEQLSQLGLVDYTLCIGVPSMFQWGSDSEYYRRPWEITAEAKSIMLGYERELKRINEEKKYPHRKCEDIFCNSGEIVYQ